MWGYEKTTSLIAWGEVVFLSWMEFLAALRASPPLMAAAALLLGVVLVNGWTDAPNAIATAVAAGSLSFRGAVALAAGCNLLGVWLVTSAAPAVTGTLYAIADFGEDAAAALVALAAALAAIVVWAVFAWVFGIPTSESHALVAGVTGAAVALRGSLAGVRWESWGKVLFGLALSLLLGFLLGGWAVERLPRGRRYRGWQVVGAGLAAFLHGAQDGQKFAGILLLAVSLAGGGAGGECPPPPLWLSGLVAGVMGLGTLLGGRRIIDTVCREMTCLPAREGFAADLGAGLCLGVATVMGLPVSTTHAKTAAVLGAGMASGQTTRGSVAGKIGVMWMLTFPVCFGIGYAAARLALLKM